MPPVTSLRDVLRFSQRAAARARSRVRPGSAEARIRATDARFRAALDASPDACFLLGAARSDDGLVSDLVFTEANAACETLYGIPARDLIGRGLCEVFPGVRDSAVWTHYRRAAETGERYETEYKTRDPRARAEWLGLQVVAFRGADGVIIGLAITARDITARKRADTVRRLLHDVTATISITPDAAGALGAALAAMCEATQMPYGETWLPIGNAGVAWAGGAVPGDKVPTGTLVRGPAWHAPDDDRLAAFAKASAAYTFAPGRGLPGRAAADRTPAWMPDVNAPGVDYPRRALAQAAGLRSGLAVPVIADGRLIAVLSFHARHAVAAGAAELELLSVVGRQLGSVLLRRQAEAELTRERSFLRAVLESLSEGILVLSADGTYKLANRAMREFHAAPVPAEGPDEWRGGREDLFRADGITPFPPDQTPLHVALATQQDVRDVDIVIAPARGPRRAVVTNARAIRSSAGEFLGAVCASRDMTAQIAAEQAVRESEARFRGVLEQIRAFAVQVETGGRVTFANDALIAATGWTRGEVVGTDDLARFISNGDEMRVSLARAAATGDASAIPAHLENEVLTRDGARRRVAWDNVLLRDANGRISGIASVGRDVTEERHLAAERERLVAALADLAEQDELTGLSNRRGFGRMAAQERRGAARTGRVDAVCCVDLDRFKAINDTYGHAAGDDALRAVAGVIRDTIRDADFAARLGGDEFVVYAVGVARDAGADVLAARLHTALAAHNRSATAAGRPYEIAFSVGATEVAPDDTLETAIARADAKLYAAKPRRTARV